MKPFSSKLALTILCFSLSAVLSCKKNSVERTATVVYQGDVAADGCDWTIRVDSTYYHPENLDNKYKVNNASVNISFDVLASKFQCGMMPVSAAHPGMSVIHINRITKAN